VTGTRGKGEPMSGTTPGPWVASPPSGVVGCAVMAGSRLVAAVMSGEANAALIAAAPDLLEALKAVEWSGSDGSTRLFCPDCEQHADGERHADDCVVGRAIAKAEGPKAEPQEGR
jgi:hypothetical protein